MPMTWDAETNLKLLLAVTKVQAVKIDYEAVAKELSTDNVTCTPKAVMDQMRRLKKQALGSGASSTPTKNESPMPKAKATPRKQNATDIVDETPTKKRKLAAKPKEGKAQDDATADQEE
ncbi:hypothetical protein LTR66_008363 [Elasticomyces elasticus]|nr:hypothetical protein LTR66_008363 [Elasticomyces elasticus]